MNTPSVHKVLRVIKKAQKYPDQLTRKELYILSLVNEVAKENLEKEIEDAVITEKPKTT